MEKVKNKFYKEFEYFFIKTPPSEKLGKDDDKCINEETGDFYRKINGKWIKEGELLNKKY